MSVFLGIILTVILSFLLFFLGHYLPTRNPGLEKNAPYECGFDPMNSPRTPFSFRFFLVAILFLIFDLEIALLLPLVSAFSRGLSSSLFYVMVFMSLLVLGLVYEWVNGGLDWAE
nr:NADH dehydrogenase subunit 3 [Euapta godeffroyi]